MKISIITVVRNNKVGFEKTAQSIINQSADSHQWEWVVIDGASTDGTIESILKYQSYISYWISEPDNGTYEAMNKSLLHCKGDYLLFMNSGDQIASNNVISKVMSNPKFGETDYIIGGFNYVNNGMIIKTFPPAHSIRGLDMFKSWVLNHQATFIKKERLLLNGGYDTSYKICADAKFFFKELIIDNRSYMSLDLTISNYDVTGISSTNYEINKNERTRFLKEVLPQPIYDDYAKFAIGETVLEKLIIKNGNNSIFYKVLTLCAIAIYLPKSFYNRFKIFIKKVVK